MNKESTFDSTLQPPLNLYCEILKNLSFTILWISKMSCFHGKVSYKKPTFRPTPEFTQKIHIQTNFVIFVGGEAPTNTYKLH